MALPAPLPAPDAAGGELTMLTQYLAVQRDVVVRKASGLTRAQLAQVLPPSTLSLAALVHHLALVEDSWMDGRFLGGGEREPWGSLDFTTDADAEMTLGRTLSPADLLAQYAESCARTDEIVSAAAGLEQLSVRPLPWGDHFSLRWALLHLIEETARHAGHMDFLREAVDGETGD